MEEINEYEGLVYTERYFNQHFPRFLFRIKMSSKINENENELKCIYEDIMIRYINMYSDCLSALIEQKYYISSKNNRSFNDANCENKLDIKNHCYDNDDLYLIVDACPTSKKYWKSWRWNIMIKSSSLPKNEDCFLTLTCGSFFNTDICETIENYSKFFIKDNDDYLYMPEYVGTGSFLTTHYICIVKYNENIQLYLKMTDDNVICLPIERKIQIFKYDIVMFNLTNMTYDDVMNSCNLVDDILDNSFSYLGYKETDIHDVIVEGCNEVNIYTLLLKPKIVKVPYSDLPINLWMEVKHI